MSEESDRDKLFLSAIIENAIQDAKSPPFPSQFDYDTDQIIVHIRKRKNAFRVANKKGLAPPEAAPLELSSKRYLYSRRHYNHIITSAINWLENDPWCHDILYLLGVNLEAFKKELAAIKAPHLPLFRAADQR